jgi:eukaryotic-like serine/threonine-protein kinase
MNSPLASGTKLGRYEIRSLLGVGGMGEVYRARDDKLNRDVAIKVLPATFSQDATRLRRFEQEAQATGTLNHPNRKRARYSSISESSGRVPLLKFR